MHTQAAKQGSKGPALPVSVRAFDRSGSEAGRDHLYRPANHRPIEHMGGIAAP